MPKHATAHIHKRWHSLKKEITQLKDKILKYNTALSKATDFIRKDLINYFSKIDYSISTDRIEVTEICNESDLDKIFYKASFYIILTNYDFKNNKCKFQYNNQRAIYRGHSYFTKRRLSSHLSNEKYKVSNNNNNYKVCLKIEEGISGININQEPYKNWKWTIIVHKMVGSSKLMREQAEKAFDELYNKPCKSRD